MSSSPTPQPSTPAAPTSRRQAGVWIVGGLAAAAGLGGYLWRGGGSPTEAPGSSAAAGAAAGSTSAPSAGSGPDEADRVGPSFWKAGWTSPDGAVLDTTAWQGRPLLLNFWATWCPPCVREMPLLDQFQQRWASKGLVVVGLAVDGPTPVRAFLTKTPVGFPIAMAGAAGSDWAKRWGNSMGGLPFSVLANREGHILARHMGELQPAQLAAWAEQAGLPG